MVIHLRYLLTHQHISLALKRSVITDGLIHMTTVHRLSMHIFRQLAYKRIMIHLSVHALAYIPFCIINTNDYESPPIAGGDNSLQLLKLYLPERISRTSFVERLYS